MGNVPSKLCSVRVRARTQVVRRARTRKLGAHINILSKNVFAHISYMSFRIQMSSGKMLQKRNFMRTLALKIEGTLAVGHKYDMPCTLMHNLRISALIHAL